MNTTKFKLILAGVKGTMVKHSPEILTGMGVVGMITAGVLAVRATPKALMLIEEKKKDTDNERLSAVETVKTALRFLVTQVTEKCGIFV